MIFILITYWNNIILDVFIECEGFIYVSTWLSHIIQMNTNLAVPWKVFFNIIKIPNQLTLNNNIILDHLVGLVWFHWKAIIMPEFSQGKRRNSACGQQLWSLPLGPSLPTIFPSWPPVLLGPTCLASPRNHTGQTLVILLLIYTSICIIYYWLCFSGWALIDT